MAIKVPPGQSPPFETVDDKHHGGIIIITAAICLVISLVCLLIRVYVRIFLNPPWGPDDIILLGATVRNQEKLTSHVNGANGIVRYLLLLSQSSFFMPRASASGQTYRYSLRRPLIAYKIPSLVSTFSTF
ncbi:hypothetical protein ACN38_g685 [Penicillium nordicum]|uniref:Uncharacterized protein n=1 Tax=Penicillium nordicum TaxID=229535 RepID=A0A0M8PA51_9EURO|nr:hypothetical protein ACN38_g685 [Penicillium nordicum]